MIALVWTAFMSMSLRRRDCRIVVPSYTVCEWATGEQWHTCSMNDDTSDQPLLPLSRVGRRSLVYVYRPRVIRLL